MIANINSPSVSMNSVSSNDSDQSHVVEPMEMLAMTQVRSQYKHVVFVHPVLFTILYHKLIFSPIFAKVKILHKTQLNC